MSAAPTSSSKVSLFELDAAIASTRSYLLSLRNAQGHWEGYLSSSALSTATAIVALRQVDAAKHELVIARGAAWLVKNQNEDGGWGDTTLSKSNLSTTLLCWSALRMFDGQSDIANEGVAIDRANHWIASQVGSLDPEDITEAVVARYGKDKTFSVPILMLCAICGTLGEDHEAWSKVLPLPFELAALPRSWFGAVGLPVVSYALPALIAIGHARFVHAPPGKWNPLRLIRGALWGRIYPMLKTLQPSSGGYLEATPLTSFVTMALASSGDKDHPCVPAAVEFLLKSEREDGSWPIDTNLATWGTTLATKALLGGDSEGEAEQETERATLRKELRPVREWLLKQQYREVHPFTNAAPGGWAWTDLPGGVPDADDTSGAVVALAYLCETDEERREALPAAEAGITWLLDLQNRDGGMPTFCRGWGTLPFDRSTPEIMAHALRGWAAWEPYVNEALRERMRGAKTRALAYLSKMRWRVWKSGTGYVSPYGDQVMLKTKQRLRLGSLHWWQPLWFGNEHTPVENNPVFGTALVLMGLLHADLTLEGGSVWGVPSISLQMHLRWLVEQQGDDGGWGGDKGVVPSVEETSVVVHVLSLTLQRMGATWEHEVRANALGAVERGVTWLLKKTRNGAEFPSAPIGLYFARLWYHEMIYPVVWSLGALRAAREVLSRV
ncbi:prenyltransferase/squalene oxidase repeat-containing protein [Roseimicrobium gellanilyticum]|uniref:prenyltransferase/squalene oxidase repeat-containing protein n=1 Tax=Roseimicrobium gellanilyticum TaxID=748857 RepID=UPI0014756341|nr:prenyltransferase/squalene oxidase repeat-containing protein [Roseimicrobium gellanilyticum]